jgi:hypothetical protein
MAIRRKGAFRILGLSLAVLAIGLNGLTAGWIAVYDLFHWSELGSLDNSLLPGVHNRFAIASAMLGLVAVYGVVVVGLLKKWKPVQFVILLGAGVSAMLELWQFWSMVAEHAPPGSMFLWVYGATIFRFLLSAIIAIYVALELFRPIPPSRPSTS